MFKNIGSKIKTLAVVFCVIEAIAAFIGGIWIMSLGGIGVGLGLLLLLLGPFVAWASSFILYGFGELIDKTCSIERTLLSEGKKSEAQSQSDYERIRKLERLHSQGLITDEEYQQAISKEQ